MKKILLILLTLTLIVCATACVNDGPVDMTEKTFFYTMTTIQAYPDQYLGRDISYDCFTYRLTDIAGNDYLCGVRKCSSGYGCNCGKDTIIGFILDYDGAIPEPKNQSEDSAEKSWIHVKGRLKSAEAEMIELQSYKIDPQSDAYVPDEGKTEKVPFYRLTVESLSEIEDYSGLAYYVTK